VEKIGRKQINSKNLKIADNYPKGAFNNYVDRILQFPPPLHLVHIVIECPLTSNSHKLFYILHKNSK
jgi:hypothetical protein